MGNTQIILWRARARATSRLLAVSALSLLGAAGSGCGAPAPKDYGGSWAPVNRFQSAPNEIPLSPVYTFYASPMDGTLRGMLNRWASDNGLQLSYQIGSDFTLQQPVARVRTNDIQSAMGELNAIYARQGMFIAADSKQIVVQPTGAAAPVAAGAR